VRDEPVHYEVVDGVAWMTINRPAARNSLSADPVWKGR
jgi:enoyl-CoA hydratase/carnithine racemase